MNALELILLLIAFMNTVYNLGDSIYRIVTEKDYCVEWKERAVSEIIGFVIWFTILVWMIIEWL